MEGFHLFHSLVADPKTSLMNLVLTMSSKLCWGVCSTPLCCFARVDVLFLDEELLCLELDDFDEVFFEEEPLLLEDVPDLDVGADWRAEEALGLADPPEVKDDAPFCLALVPRLAEDMVISRQRCLA